MLKKYKFWYLSSSNKQPDTDKVSRFLKNLLGIFTTDCLLDVSKINWFECHVFDYHDLKGIWQAT